MSAAQSPLTPLQDPKLAPVRVPAPPRRADDRRGRKSAWLVIAAVLIAAAGFGAWRLIQNRQAEAARAAATAAFAKTATAYTGTLAATVRVTGQTAATHFVNVTAPTMKGPESRDLILMEVAPAGSWIKKGSLVAKIDGQAILDHIEDLNDTIDTAQSDVRKRRAEQSIELENLMQSLRLAKADADKARLEYNGSETQTDIQRQLLKLTLDEADAKYKELQTDVAQKKTSHSAELRILELTLERHTRHRNRHQNDAKAFSVYASMDGLVVMQQIWRGSDMGQVQKGDRLSPGQPFMKIVNTNFMQVEGSINQAESSQFRVGEPAKISLDAFPGLTFEGKVHSIGALAAAGMRSSSYYVRTVPIRLDITGKDPKLIPDLSASADVVMQKADNQVIVPLAALTEENGKAFVQVKGTEGWESRQVATGIRSETQVAVASGIKPGEVVRLND